MRFNSENAAEYGSKGGQNKYKHVSKFREWVDEKGWNRLIGWAESNKFHEAFPATRFIFEMAYGKPKEQINIENSTQILIGLSKDPFLNALANRFGLIAGGRREIKAGGVGDGSTPVETVAASVPSV
jgi:hypothetical protein